MKNNLKSLPFYLIKKEYQKAYRSVSLSTIIWNKIQHVFFVSKDIISKKRYYIDKYEVEQGALALLKENELVNFSILLQNGYRMPKEQKTLYDYKLSYYIENNLWEEINIMIKNGLILPPHIIKHIFFHYSFHIYCGEYMKKKYDFYHLPEKQFQEKYHFSKEKMNTLIEKELIKSFKGKFDYITPVIFQYILSKDGFHDVFNDWIQVIQNITYYDINLLPCVIYDTFRFFEISILHSLTQEQLISIKKSLELYKKHLILLTHYSSDLSSIQLCIDKTQELININQFVTTNEAVKNINVDNSFDILLETTHRLYKKEVLPLSTQSTQSIKQGELYLPQTLPNHIKDLLQEINNIYDKIIVHKNSLNINIILDIERLKHQRIPEILHKYQIIDQNIVVEHFQQSKLPIDILHDTLVDIKDIFFKLYLSITEQQLSDLNASHRYTQELKNNHYEHEKEMNS